MLFSGGKSQNIQKLFHEFEPASIVLEIITYTSQWRHSMSNVNNLHAILCIFFAMLRPAVTDVAHAQTQTQSRRIGQGHGRI